jgi:hypothetical protein
VVEQRAIAESLGQRRELDHGVGGAGVRRPLEAAAVRGVQNGGVRNTMRL